MFFPMYAAGSGSALPSLGPGAGTYNFPSSVTLDAQGRVTAVGADFRTGGFVMSGAAGSITLGQAGLLSTASAGPVTLGNLTGDCSLPTGNLSWAGAAAKTASFVGAAGFTITAGAASTWSTTAGQLTLSGVSLMLQSSGVNFLGLETSSGNIIDAYKNVRFNSNVSEAAGTQQFDLSGASGFFKTTTGACTFGGSSNTFTNGVLAPSLDTAAAAALGIGGANANRVDLGGAAALVNFNYATSANGTTTVAVNPFVGGTGGPQTATSTNWLKVKVNNAVFFVPLWT